MDCYLIKRSLLISGFLIILLLAHPGHLKQLTLFKPLKKSPLLSYGVPLPVEIGPGTIEVDFFGTPFDIKYPFIGAGK
jgi:hypothetical protein